MKNTTLRRMPPELKRLGTNRAMMVKDALRLRINPGQI
jgi:hypothetical protein